MGWCSGTEIFDNMADEITSPYYDMSPGLAADLLNELIRNLRDHDWDCESDSKYWDDPFIGKLLRRPNGR